MQVIIIIRHTLHDINYYIEIWRNICLIVLVRGGRADGEEWPGDEEDRKTTQVKMIVQLRRRGIIVIKDTIL